MKNRKLIAITLVCMFVFLTGCGTVTKIKNIEPRGINTESSEVKSTDVSYENYLGYDNVGYLDARNFISLMTNGEITDGEMSSDNYVITDYNSEDSYNAHYYIDSADDTSLVSIEMIVANNVLDVFKDEKAAVKAAFSGDDVTEFDNLSSNIKRAYYKYSNSDQTLEDTCYYVVENKDGTTTFICTQYYDRYYEDAGLSVPELEKFKQESDNMVKSYVSLDNIPKWTNTGLVNGKLDINVNHYDKDGKTVIFEDSNFNPIYLDCKYFNEPTDNDLMTYGFGGLLSTNDYGCSLIRYLTINDKSARMEIQGLKGKEKDHSTDEVEFTVDTEYGTATAYKTYGEPQIELNGFQFMIFGEEEDLKEDDYKEIIKSLVFKDGK